jgi:anti-anti-sigma factor
MTFTIHSVQEDDVVVVQVGGELDVATAEELWSHLSEWIQRGKRQILIDCTDVVFLDCSGISALVRCLRAVSSLGGWMRLRQVSATVLRLLTITGLADAFLGEYEIREAGGGGDPNW